MLEVGKSYSLESTVTPECSAKVVGSGEIDVFGTPAMIALMEHAAVLLLSPDMEEGKTTVGTKININHTRGTKIGAKVKVTAKIEAVDGRRLELSLLAEDEKGPIGNGTHERFIIDKERFLAKL